MICRLLYNDRNLAADRPTMMTSPAVQSGYDRVFGYDAGRLYVVRTHGDRSRAVNYPE
jgi:hypothetical protein